MSEQNKDQNVEPNCDCYVKQYTMRPCPPVKNVTHPLRYYEFTQDELRALEECDKESFYTRCLPLSTLFASLTFAAIKFGFMKKDPHFGSVPKIFLAVLVGHLYGRLSYMNQCDEKIREVLPADSELSKIMWKYHKAATASADAHKK